MLDGIDPILIVVVTLAAVLALALAWQPTGYYGVWKTLADQFATDRRPSATAFPDEHIYVGSLAGLFGEGARASSGFAKFQAQVDEEGLWLLYEGPMPEKASPSLFIPGFKIRFVRNKGSQYKFRIDAGKPVGFIAYRELGEAIMRRCLGSNPGQGLT